MSAGNPKWNEKTLNGLIPKDYAATAPTTSESQKIDTAGFRFAKAILNVGNVAGTSIAWKISESSDNFVSDTAADVAGATGTLIGNTGDNQTQVIIVDCTKSERYLQATFTFDTVTASALSLIWILSEPIDSVYVGTGGVDAKVVAAV